MQNLFVKIANSVAEFSEVKKPFREMKNPIRILSRILYYIFFVPVMLIIVMFAFIKYSNKNQSNPESVQTVINEPNELDSKEKEVDVTHLKSMSQYLQEQNYQILMKMFKFNKEFDRLGIILETESRDNSYSCTPPNAKRLGRTGGDGVHFSVMMNGNIVMTVPMSFDKQNLLVGKDLYQFLCLGYYTGYFVLEQLAYTNDSLPNRYTKLVAEMTEETKEDAQFLNAREIIRKEFNLKPITDIEKTVSFIAQKWMYTLSRIRDLVVFRSDFHQRAIELVTEQLDIAAPNPFTNLNSVEFSNVKTEVKNFIEEFYIAENAKYPVAALYIEMNAFDINPEQWFFTIFAFEKDTIKTYYDNVNILGDSILKGYLTTRKANASLTTNEMIIQSNEYSTLLKNDYNIIEKWLSDYRSTSDDYVLNGLEAIQSIYKDIKNKSITVESNTHLLASLMILLKFQKLIYESLQDSIINNIPIISTAHDYDFYDIVYLSKS